MLCVRRWSDARPAGRVRCWQEQSQEPKSGQQKVQLSSKTKHFAHLGMLFIYGTKCTHTVMSENCEGTTRRANTVLNVTKMIFFNLHFG